MDPTITAPLRAVLWDFGGVITASPFDAFARYEAERGLPAGFIRTVNATNPDSNAWARLERTELSPEAFDGEFAAESEQLGHRVAGAEILALLAGDLRPEMVTALDRVVAAGYRTACLTNNIAAMDERRDLAPIMQRFDVVLESSKVGVRKPEVRFYDLACAQLGVEPPECVFLDDLGINLKPAAAMGMTTIKVRDPAVAISDLEAALGITLR